MRVDQPDAIGAVQRATCWRRGGPRCRDECGVAAVVDRCAGLRCSAAQRQQRFGQGVEFLSQEGMSLAFLAALSRLCSRALIRALALLLLWWKR